MFDGGVAGTTIEDVRAAAGVSSSQVYHYFKDKKALVEAVIEYQTETIVGGQEPMLAALDSLEGLRAWRDFPVKHQEELGCRGAAQSGRWAASSLRPIPMPAQGVAASFRRWLGAIRSGLRGMQARGELGRADADELVWPRSQLAGRPAAHPGAAQHQVAGNGPGRDAGADRARGGRLSAASPAPRLAADAAARPGPA